MVSICRYSCLTILVALIAVVLYRGPQNIGNIAYQLQQASNSIKVLWAIPKEDYDDFLGAFKVFERDGNYFYEDKSDDFKQVQKYYKVLNILCTLGNVEKMYFPPIMDPKQGVFENQMLFEKGFADQLDLSQGKKALEIGCGRGRITHHVGSHTGADIVAMNIDPKQIEIANAYANETGMSGQLKFLQGNMNDPFPFPDNTFDAFYQVQAMTYAANLTGVLSEIYRVVKPGAKISILDGVMLDNYKENDPHHRKLLWETRVVTGWGNLWHHAYWTESAEKAGFKVLKSFDPGFSESREGSQALLIEQEGRYFGVLAFFVKVGCKLGMLPPHLDVLMERLNRHGESFVEMDKKGMLTTGWHIMAQKPGP
jgi:sterol 24-C-methyltransferase